MSGDQDNTHRRGGGALESACANNASQPTRHRRLERHTDRHTRERKERKTRVATTTPQPRNRLHLYLFDPRTTSQTEPTMRIVHSLLLGALSTAAASHLRAVDSPQLGCSAFGCQPARDGHYYPCAGSDGMCYPYCCSGGATCSTAPCLSDSDLEFLGATGCVPVDCAGCVARAVLCASL